jgi:uncharacterized protein YndB with AHSA1/START domain
MVSSDKIEKHVTLRAPVSRVWKAITNARQFGQWFGVELEGEFVAGKPIRGLFDASRVNEAEIVEHQKKMGLRPSKLKMPKGATVFGTVERIEPETYFSFRWIPYGIDAEADLENEPTTLVEFRLAKAVAGEGDATMLSIVESGFDKVPAHRRERAFHMNEGGWAAQIENVRKYVETT